MSNNTQELAPELARHRILPTRLAGPFCGYSASRWRKLSKAGKTPAPVRLSENRLGWSIGDLIDWLESRKTKTAA